MTNILKASGEKDLFSEEKLLLSIQRAGIPKDLWEEAVNYVKSKLYDNIPTSEIYKNILEFLKNSPQPFSQSRYSLKRAIMDLGPTGYPFEDFVEEIFKLQGYETSVRQTLSGKCISHEIDIIAEKDGKRSMVECKFHNNPGTKSQVHVPLYTKARFDDIKEKNNLSECWLVTNTKITSDAHDFAICSQMKVIGWDFPQENNFRDLVGKFQLYPITVLIGISSGQKQQLSQNHVVLVRDIRKNPSSLDILGLPKDKKDAVISECQFLYG